MTLVVVAALMTVAVYGVNVAPDTMRFDLHASTSGVILFMGALGLTAPWHTAVVLLNYYDRRVRLEAIDSDDEPNTASA